MSTQSTNSLNSDKLKQLIHTCHPATLTFLRKVLEGELASRKNANVPCANVVIAQLYWDGTLGETKETDQAVLSELEKILKAAQSL